MSDGWYFVPYDNMTNTPAYYRNRSGYVISVAEYNAGLTDPKVLAVTRKIEKVIGLR